jgi:hypothetical protein
VRARRGGGAVTLAGVEGEWLATNRLGLRIEPSLVSIRRSSLDSHTDLSVGTTAAWKLVRDFAHDFYMQAEAGAEWPPNKEDYPPPDQPGLPFALDVRAAWRQGVWTMRGSLGTGLGAASPHVPLRASLAFLIGFDGSDRAGFFGIEALTDGTWTSPVFVAPNVVADLAPVGLPMRIGIALPWSPSANDSQPSLGVYLRLMVEPFRELHGQDR